MIRPTIGRKVWFWPHGRFEMNSLSEKQPLDATVVYVHNDRHVNLVVIDHLGHSHALNNVTLIQPEDDAQRDMLETSHECFCEWMDYQKKVA